MIPGAEPPTNLHVLVGRNGVGKTRCIQGIINTLMERDSPSAPRGTLERLGANHAEWTFSGLVSVCSISTETAPFARLLKLRVDYYFEKIGEGIGRSTAEP